MTLQLFIGNKAYSSWSLRPWILLKVFDIPFAETVIPMYRPETRAEMLAVGPTGKVPVLHDGDIVVSESLAIIEFIAESFPDRPIWPGDRAARALARAISSEMHAGFMKLRQTCPTNFRRLPKAIPISPEVRADVDRIEAVWADARARFGKDGPFLFGAFLGGRRHVRPCGQQAACLRGPGPPGDAVLYGGHHGPAGLEAWIAGGEAEPWRVFEYDDL